MYRLVYLKPIKMTKLPNVLQSKTKIRFQDCDPFNHLNNGSYINYFMNHREDAILEHYHIDIYKMALKEGKSWVSSSNQIGYLKPAFFNGNCRFRISTYQLFKLRTYGRNANV